jgi:dynein heavy chain
MVLDVHTVSWRKTAYVGDLPSSRADTEMIYCANFGKLILFGGWSSRWHDDVCTCDVSQIVGPPYTISAIEPSEWKSSIGPITGSTSMILKGTGFLTYVGTPACVRFACHKGFVDVSGVVVDNETISTRTPNYEKFGPVKAEISLKLGSHSFTNVTLDFNYFSVTDSSKTVAFGPGLLSNMRIGCVEKFFIQAKDKNGHDRVCGMDDFRISIGFLGDIETVKILHTLKDQGDGTYLVEYRPALPGSYKIDVEFCGTFGSRAGAICGSPFQAHTSTDQNPDQNDLDGMSMQTHIAKTINQIKENSMNICRGLNSTVSNDNIKSLISVKESLKTVHECMSLWDSTISSNRAALNYCKRMNIRFPKLDATLRNLEAVADNWAEAKVLAESVVERIASIDRDWTEKVKLQVDSYLQDLTSRKVNFRALPIWSFIEEQSVDGYDRNDQFQSMRESISREATILSEFTYLSSMFDLADTIMPCILLVDEMKQELDELMNLLKVYDNLKEYVWAISSCKWDDVDIEVLELGLKAQMKDIKKVHKCIHWSDAYKLVEKKCKDLTVSIPLVGLLKSDAMCERHWAILYEATNCVNSASPLLERNFTLGHILSMNIHMFIAEVEDITDRAMKEQKMEITIIDIRERWSNITFISTGSNEGIALLGISEDDYETLESDLLTLQGMLASRYLSYFEENVNTLNKELFNVNEVYASVLEIQRTWSYLEPLFVQSEEVKLELPEDTMRFAAIDLDFRSVLKTAWSINCVKIAFNQNGLQEVLDGVLEQLDMCKKSLSDFLDGRRRQFPRYYFVSEADLLDILSNGNNPEQILVHIPKVFLATKSINFSETDQSPCGRPIAHEFISGVGSEACKFEPPVPLVGKVEIYMQSILDGQKLSLFRSLERSLVRYHQQSRVDWILAKDHVLGRALDPAQITLLVAAINYVDEVETAFECMRTGEATSFSNLANKHMQQLGDLIDRTRSNLTNGERSRLMACITMDAHSRDIIDRIIREKVQSSDSFIWQSQLKHKYRFPPPHARHQDRDNKLRGPTGERAEIAICDAILPYDYEYLGNGPRLVVTPLTDRIYVTATQALNLNLGCAPAGPAGTGKTETTKDLANALAKLIYVINCKFRDYSSLLKRYDCPSLLIFLKVPLKWTTKD